MLCVQFNVAATPTFNETKKHAVYQLLQAMCANSKRSAEALHK